MSPSGIPVPDPWQLHGEGLEDSPPLGGAGEEEEDEAELEEGRGCGGRSPGGLRGRSQGGGSPKGSGEGGWGGAVPRGRPRGAVPPPSSSQSPSTPGPLKTAKPGSSGRRPPGLRGRGGGGSGCAPRLGWGLCGVPGCGVHGLESGEGTGAGCEGESKPESSTFSGEEEEKGEEEEVRT